MNQALEKAIERLTEQLAKLKEESENGGIDAEDAVMLRDKINQLSDVL